MKEFPIWGSTVASCNNFRKYKAWPVKNRVTLKNFIVGIWLFAKFRQICGHFLVAAYFNSEKEKQKTHSGTCIHEHERTHGCTDAHTHSNIQEAFILKTSQKKCETQIIILFETRFPAFILPFNKKNNNKTGQTKTAFATNSQNFWENVDCN